MSFQWDIIVSRKGYDSDYRIVVGESHYRSLLNMEDFPIVLPKSGNP